MNLKKPVTLIGLMGAGKTTVGAYLAAKLDVPFLDSDKVIEEQAGVSINEIFKRDGEAFFRKVEAKVISEILSGGKICVLATGGGAFVNEQTREIIREKSTSIWLRAGLATLLQRVEHSNARPLLNNDNRDKILEKLMLDRYPLYEKAHIIVDTDSNSRTIVASKILTELEAREA